jgi:hypothetical protein
MNVVPNVVQQNSNCYLVDKSGRIPVLTNLKPLYFNSVRFVIILGIFEESQQFMTGLEGVTTNPLYLIGRGCSAQSFL